MLVYRHLGLIIAYLYPEVKVILLERKEYSSEVAKKRISELGIENCSIRCCDIYDFDPVAEG